MKLFTRQQSSKMSDSEIRKEYSRLRSIANKRIKRLSEQGLNYGNRALFSRIKDLATGSAIESALLNVSKFLRSERTTVIGEKKFLNEFKVNMIDMGYGELVTNTEDIYKMLDFMEHMREIYSNKIFDSGDALDVLQQAKRLNIPYDKVKKYFDEFSAHVEELEDVKPSKEGKEFSQRRIRNLIKKWNK